LLAIVAAGSIFMLSADALAREPEDLETLVPEQRPRQGPEQGPKQGQEHQVAIVGYGSLVNRESIGRSLGQNYDGPLVPITLHGFQRDLSAVMPNRDFAYWAGGQLVKPDGIAYYNLRRADASVRAVLFFVPESALPAFDHRERIYDRVDVTGWFTGATIAARVYAYVAKPEYRAENFRGAVAIRRSYLQIVRAAIFSLGPTFAAQFEATTTSSGASKVPVIDDILQPGADPFGHAAVAARRRACAGIFASQARTIH
jgi:hypothetical protein